MTDRQIPIPSEISVTLRTKLILGTTVILIVTCLLLSWLFIQQQTRSISDGLVQTGTLLAQHLARAGQSSIMVGDTRRLRQLLQEALAVNPVVYVVVISSSGNLQVGIGKDIWQQQFSLLPTGQQEFSVTTLVQRQGRGIDTDDPFVSGIWLAHDKPLLRNQIEFTLAELLSLVWGSELPIVYDMIVHVPRYPLTTTRDSALELTLEEHLGDPESFTAPPDGVSAFVQVGLSTAHVQQDLRRLLWQAAAITLSVLATSVLIAMLFAQKMTTPLQDLSRAAKRLTSGDAVSQIDVRADDEIGGLTRLFNIMSATLQSREHELRELAHNLEERVETRTQELGAAVSKLQELDRRKSMFVSTASHELRTPLTSMMVHLANLRDGVDGPITDDQRLSLSRVETKLSDLHNLIDELLDLSRIEDGHITAHLEPVVLGSIIVKAVDDLQALAQGRHVKILMSLPADLPPVLADPNKLYRIVLNLLHNAIKFTDTGTTIDISVASFPDDEIQISIRDAGPGIESDDVNKIFQPFYRGSSTLGKVNGAGLGLTITKLLVELHHGRLWVETSPGQGSCFSFSLHAAPVVVPISGDALHFSPTSPQ